VICAAILVCCLVGLPAASIMLAEATLHVPRNVGHIPSSVQAQTRGADWRDVAIRATDGVELRAWFVRPPHPNGNCVAVLHGVGDSRLGSAGFAPLFVSEGYAVLLPDSRAHGSSGGAIVTYGVLEKYDILQWADWLREQGCAKSYGLGESLGAAVLIEAAAIRPAFLAIAAECSFADLPSIAQYRVARMSRLPDSLTGLLSPILVKGAFFYTRIRYGVDLDQASPVTSIARATVPVLLIHGLLDESTPVAHSQRLARADPNAVLWLVPGAGHVGAFAAAPQEFRDRLRAWFAMR
jgi:uncharacterized protein